ncbi:hypothetical protein CL634_03070 [bacterium]|nr:hypothetical protein [bacterium]
MFRIYILQNPLLGGFVSYVLEKCNSHNKTLDFLQERRYSKFTMSLRIPIGVSGVAGAGKDLFFSLLSKRMGVRRFALADKLKWECAAWCNNEYDIDPLGCTREEKEKIREFLVFHGTFKRKTSKGRHWIDKLDSDIKGFLLNAQTDDVPVVTDIRYQEYKNDEVSWIQNELNGVLVHVSQYEIKEVTSKGEWPKKEMKKVFREPINFEEARQDPIVMGKADFLVKWPKIKGDNLLENEYLNQEVENFTNWYNERITRR